MELSGDFYTRLSAGIVDGRQTYRLGLNPEHWIFGCHFPEQPIVPGVCIAQMLAESLSETLGRKLYIKELKRVKFIAPVYPQKTPELLFTLTSLSDDTENVKLSATLCDALHPEILLAKMSLTLVSSQF